MQISEKHTSTSLIKCSQTYPQLIITKFHGKKTLSPFKTNRMDQINEILTKAASKLETDSKLVEFDRWSTRNCTQGRRMVSHAHPSMWLHIMWSPWKMTKIIHNTALHTCCCCLNSYDERISVSPSKRMCFLMSKRFRFECQFWQNIPVHTGPSDNMLRGYFLLSGLIIYSNSCLCYS